MPQNDVARTGSPAVGPLRPLFLHQVHHSAHDVFIRLRSRVGHACLLLLLLLFLTFSALVANPKKTTLHGGQSRSWSAEQGKKEKEKVWQRTPPPPRARCSFGEKIKIKK